MKTVKMIVLNFGKINKLKKYIKNNRLSWWQKLLHLYENIIILKILQLLSIIYFHVIIVTSINKFINNF